MPNATAQSAHFLDGNMLAAEASQHYYTRNLRRLEEQVPLSFCDANVDIYLAVSSCFIALFVLSYGILLLLPLVFMLLLLLLVETCANAIRTEMK
eukprot:4412003-Pleurochrysis_carterae.AAC.1